MIVYLVVMNSKRCSIDTKKGTFIEIKTLLNLKIPFSAH